MKLFFILTAIFGLSFSFNLPFKVAGLFLQSNPKNTATDNEALWVKEVHGLKTANDKNNVGIKCIPL